MIGAASASNITSYLARRANITSYPRRDTLTLEPARLRIGFFLVVFYLMLLLLLRLVVVVIVGDGFVDGKLFPAVRPASARWRPPASGQS